MSGLRPVLAGNLLAGLPPAGAEETFTPLAGGRSVHIERIVSHGHASDPGFWYDQQDDEWVLVVEGEAELEIEGEAATRTLRQGDWLLLPAHCRHRVVRTATDRPTVWLAVHFTTAPNRENVAGDKENSGTAWPRTQPHETL